VLDVAHNPHAAAVLAQNLDQMGYYPRTHAVLGAMGDKDLVGLVRALLPMVDAWYCCDLPTPRAATASRLAEAVATARQGRAAGLAPLPAASCSTHAGPVEALAAAVSAADPTDRIVVFGSFFTVGGVLSAGVPRLGSAHLG
jgi:dihydrofolate synthase/folylpolyglutamate synthase